MADLILRMDSAALIWIQDTLRYPFLDGFFVFYTKLGDSGRLWLCLSVLLLLFRRTRKAGILGILAIALGTLLTNITLKPLISRERPWLELSALVPLISEDDPLSFPSGHTCAAFAMAGIWWSTLDLRWLRYLAMGLAILMGFSRLYVGVHYPLDVLAGCGMGLLSAWLVLLMVRRVNGRRV